MQAFVVLIGKGGRVADAAVDAVLASAPTDLAFPAEEQLRWSDDEGRVVLLGWQAHVDVLGVGSHWHVDGTGVTAFTGHVWPRGGSWPAGASWAHGLARHWDRHRVTDTSTLGGTFTAVSLRRDGSGSLVTDPLSVGLLYRSEDADVVAYASRAALAARATAPLGAEPARDPWTTGWLAAVGHVVGDGTGYVGTRALPLGSEVEVDPRFGSRVRSSCPAPWTGDLPTSTDDIVERVHEDLAAEVRSIAGLPVGGLLADLTGGMDSRLVLALLVQEGLVDRVAFRTIGHADSPDVLVASALASELGLDHDVDGPVPMDHSLFERRLSTHVSQTSGCLNAWDLQGGTGVALTPRLTGVATTLRLEPLRDDGPAAVDGHLRRTVEHRSWLLGPDARRHYAEVLREELTRRLDLGGATVRDRFDSSYLRHRMRRWSGTMAELNPGLRLFPLCSPVGVQAGFALGPAARRDELLTFEVMRRACDALARQPFAGRGWSEELLAGVPDGSAYASAPVTAEVPDRSRWQIDRLAANRDVLEAHLLHDPPEELFEVFDRDALRRALAGDQPIDIRRSQALYGALTAAVWLGRRERPHLIGGPEPEGSPLAVRSSRPPAASPSPPDPADEDPPAPRPLTLRRLVRAARRRLAARIEPPPTGRPTR